MIGASGEGIHIRDLREQPSWVLNESWVRAEGVISFAGHPLIFHGHNYGVLGVFFREYICVDVFRLIRQFADHSAAALANAQAFEEIDRLRDRLAQENTFLREEARSKSESGTIVGQSAALRNVLRQVDLVAPTNSAVLIQGESGTGKELVAEAIHNASKRNGKPFIRVNCASIPRELFESEFFGHVKGAFTGAVSDRMGRFELADGGTLFLDEIGEVPLDLQSKLLRALEEGTFERVGGTETRQTDVRIISATNRDLFADIGKNLFRQDLYYRLSVFPLSVPPLRERLEDIPRLVNHFLNKVGGRHGIPTRRLSEEHLQHLCTYDWPGNIRELQNVIERAVIVAQGGIVDFEIPGLYPGTSWNQPKPAPLNCVYTYQELKEIEQENIQRALQRTKGKVSGRGGAAELLGIKANTLSARMKSMGISRLR